LLLFLSLCAVPATAASSTATRWAEPQAAVWDTLHTLELHSQWAALESLSVQLLPRFAHEPDSLDYSRALYLIALGRLNRRLFQDGTGFAALENAIGIRRRHAAPGDSLRARALTFGSTIYTESGRPDLGRDAALEDLQVLAAQSRPDSIELAGAHLALGDAYAALGKYEEAHAAYQRALELREAKVGPENRELVPMLAEYGLFLTKIGEFDLARQLLTRGVRIALRDTVPHSLYLEGTEARLSTLEDQAGNLSESIEWAQRAYVHARQSAGESSIATIRARTILAYRLREIGDPAAAAAHLSVIVPEMESKLGPANPQTINARLSWGTSALAMGDTATARHAVRDARAALAGHEELANENVAYVRQLDADISRWAGSYAAARETLLVAIEHESGKHDPRPDKEIELYRHLFDSCPESAGRAVVQEAVQGSERLRERGKTAAAPGWAEMLSSRAAAEARVGMAEAAWTDAVEAEGHARERLGYELAGLPERGALEFAQALGTPCDLLVWLARSGDETKAYTAWDRVVRWRGLVGQEIARRRPPATASADTAIEGTHARWIAAQRRLAQMVVSGAAHPEDRAAADRVENARRAAEEAERSYVRAAGESAGSRDSVTLSRVNARLLSGQALVAYVVGAGDEVDKRLLAFVRVGPGGDLRLVDLGPRAARESELEAWLAAVQAPPAQSLAAASEAACRRLGETVRAHLWDPIARDLAGAHDVFVVPEGALFGLPWMALPRHASGYLAEDPIALHVLNAERDLLARTSPASGGLLAVGGPDFDHVSEEPAAPAPESASLAADIRRSHAMPCDREPSALPPLPAARAEAEDIVARWPASAGAKRLLVGAAADEATFKHEAPGRSVIHLATHGIVVSDTCGALAPPGTRGIGGVSFAAARPADAGSAAPAPAESPSPRAPRASQLWLALAGANRPLSEAKSENEGILTAEEVVTLDLRGTDWVVLSACQSGVAPTWEREGVLGMRRAFHLAGARSVIASQWPVADRATREWMRALYDARARGDAAGVAVQHACRSVLAARRADGRSTHPFYWAAFTATGE
jgi:CHAT domain-containing protein